MYKLCLVLELFLGFLRNTCGSLQILPSIFLKLAANARYMRSELTLKLRHRFNQAIKKLLTFFEVLDGLLLDLHGFLLSCSDLFLHLLIFVLILFFDTLQLFLELCLGVTVSVLDLLLNTLLFLFELVQGFLLHLQGFFALSLNFVHGPLLRLRSFFLNAQ